MGKCVGYGEYKGSCPHGTQENGSIIFCSRCSELRKEEIEKTKQIQKKAQEKTEKIVQERT